MEFGSSTKLGKDSFGCWEVSSSSPADIVLDLCYCSSVPNSHLTLWPHGLQNARLLYPSLSPRVCSDTCLLSEWCYLTISSTSARFFFCLQSFPASGVFFFFFSESDFCIKWPKYWNFSFSISPSNKYSGLISFRIDKLDLLAALRTSNSPLQLHSQKPSVIQHAAFFMVQFSHLYMTTGNTIVLTIQIFVSKVMSLLFSMLSRFVIAFLPRSKCVLISWLQWLSQWFQSPRK